MLIPQNKMMLRANEQLTKRKVLITSQFTGQQVPQLAPKISTCANNSNLIRSEIETNSDH